MARRDKPPLAASILIIGRLVLHVLGALVIVVLRFPRWSDRRRQAAIRRWSRKLLSILRVRLRCIQSPKRLPDRCLLVLNHVSWLDIFLVDAVHPAVFVAMAEIGDWPVLGTITKRVRTVFIERGSRSAARRTNQHIAAALTSGSPVACFPEGATSLGHSVHRFHGALFQPAIDSGAMVQPIALRYLDASGRISEASAYVGDDTLAKSLWRLISHPPVVGELRFLPAVDAGKKDRRSLALQMRSEIARALEPD